MTESMTPTPWRIVSAALTPRPVTKSEVLDVCRALEDATLLDAPERAVCVLQDARFASDRTRAFWTDLAAGGTQVSVLARDLVGVAYPGVRTVPLDEDSPFVDHWAYLIRWPDGRAHAMIAMDAPAPSEGRPLADLERPLLLVETDDASLVDRSLAAVQAADTAG